MELACKEWDSCDKLDNYFTQQAQKDVSITATLAPTNKNGSTVLTWKAKHRLLQNQDIHYTYTSMCVYKRDTPTEKICLHLIDYHFLEFGHFPG